jgi:hypothetical protein
MQDRSLRGLVVTLEPFHLVQTFLYDDVLGETPIRITIASAHALGVLSRQVGDAAGGWEAP